MLDFATSCVVCLGNVGITYYNFFNFSSNSIQRIKMFYTNIVSCVTVNGNLSDWFYIHRGCRQGDPLSPYLFIIRAQNLSILIKYNDNIRGIKVDAENILLSQYADDKTLSLDGSENSLRSTMSVYI